VSEQGLFLLTRMPALCCAVAVLLPSAAGAREILVASRDAGLMRQTCEALQELGARPAVELHSSRLLEQVLELESALRVIQRAKEAYSEGDVEAAWQAADSAVEILGRSLGVVQDFDRVARAYLFHADLATARGEEGIAEGDFLIAARLGPRLSLDAGSTSPVVIEGYRTAQALLATSPPGGLTVKVEPEGATIWVDNQARGQSPLSVTLGAGPHLVRVEQEGYELWATQVPVEAGDVRELEVFLTPAGPVDLALTMPSVDSVRALQELDAERDWLVIEPGDEGPAYVMVTVEGTAVDGGPISLEELAEVVELARHGGREQEPEPEQAEEAPLHWGWIVASASGGVAATSAAGMLAIEGVFRLSSQGTGEERAGMHLGERVLFGTTLLGLAGAGLGAVLAMESTDE